MSTKRFGRAHKAGAILPLALLSAAWTASLTTAATGPAVVSADQLAPDVSVSLPDGASVPNDAIEAPASVSASEGAGLGVRNADTQQVVANASTNGIPSAALAAYQRAETVINSADKKCNVSWQLIAGIGRVESNHGRFGGNTLNDEGVATPGIYGIALDGSRNTKVIRDTDAGQFDNDLKFDRAVGPMQFIPSTWSVVGVDADGDGMRNPQDIDDAALGTAVYLCSGNDNLATEAGQRAAIYRYNNSQSYVNLVLSIAEAYLDGDFTSVPNESLAAGFFVPAPAPSTPQGNGQGKDNDKSDGDKTVEAAPPVSSPSPSASPSTSGDKGGTKDNDGGTKGGNTPSPVPVPSVTVTPLPSTSIEPVDNLLTVAQAIVQCTLDGFLDNPLVNNDNFDQCIKDYTTKGGSKP
ncbi:hypothetical protein GCM10027020_26210 [Nocardioides salsibiostraticola]